MVRLLIFLVIVVLIQFLLTWVLTHYGLIVLGACSWWMVESLERTHSCLARRRLLRSSPLDGYGHLGVAARTFPHVGTFLVLVVSAQLVPFGPLMVAVAVLVTLQKRPPFVGDSFLPCKRIVITAIRMLLSGTARLSGATAQRRK